MRMLNYNGSIFGEKGSRRLIDSTKQTTFTHTIMRDSERVICFCVSWQKMQIKASPKDLINFSLLPPLANCDIISFDSLFSPV